MALPIERLQIQNYGCIRDATVELTPLTVLVGPNDSGKSMLLDALNSVVRASRSPLGWKDVFHHGWDVHERTFQRRGGTLMLSISGATTDDTPYKYVARVQGSLADPGLIRERIEVGGVSVERSLTNFEVDPGGTEHVVPVDSFIPLLSHTGINALRGKHDTHLWDSILDAIYSARLFALRPEQLRKSALLDDRAPMRLHSDGLGLPHLYAQLLLRRRDVCERIERSLREAMPQVSQVNAEPVNLADSAAATNGDRGFRLEIMTRQGTLVPNYLISDGVLLFLGYLYVVLGPDPASVLMIEEPETGVHPGLLRKLVQLFRDMTTGAHGGPPTQVILTTHSPMLLNLVEPEEIRVVQRGDDGATTVTPFAGAPGLDELLDYQGPGEIWVNQGEEYLTRRTATS